jgi:hypothetical protein
MDVVTVLSTVVTVAVAVGGATFWLGSELKGIKRDIERLGESLGRLANVINSVGESIVEYLGLRGVLNQGDVNYLKSEIRRLASTRN